MEINQVNPNQMISAAETGIKEESESSLKEPVETARELITWTMELLTTLAIPLTAKSILPPSAYPYPEMRKDVKALDEWVKQTQSHLGSLNLGLRGCSLIFWSQLLGAKREILEKAEKGLKNLPKDDPGVKMALDKVVSALLVLEKEEETYLEQKRSWGWRALRQGLRITQPYLKELGKVASFTAIAKVANHAFQWTISSLGLLFSGQAFKKALADWKVYKKSSADFETTLRFPQSTVPAPPSVQESAVWNPEEAKMWIQKKEQDRKEELGLLDNQAKEVVAQWEEHSPNILKAIQSHQKLDLLEKNPITFFQQRYGCSEAEAGFLSNLMEIDIRQTELSLHLKGHSEIEKIALAKLLLGYQRDQQEMRMHAVKNGLLEMVAAKHKMEGAFLKLKLGDTGSIFTISTLQFVAQLALLILGLATISFGGAGVILFWLAVASFAATGAITLGSVYYTTKKRYHRSVEEFQFVNARLFYANLRKNIAKHQLARYHLLVRNPDKGRVTEMQQKVRKWEETSDAMQERISRASWKDFAKQYLYQWQKWGKPENVVLEALSQALKESDPKLLDRENSQLLREYFGISQKSFQPDTDVLQKQLRHFFTFDHIELVKFMKKHAPRADSGAA